MAAMSHRLIIIPPPQAVGTFSWTMDFGWKGTYVTPNSNTLKIKRWAAGGHFDNANPNSDPNANANSNANHSSNHLP